MQISQSARDARRLASRFVHREEVLVALPWRSVRRIGEKEYLRGQVRDSGVDDLAFLFAHQLNKKQRVRKIRKRVLKTLRAMESFEFRLIGLTILTDNHRFVSGGTTQ